VNRVGRRYGVDDYCRMVFFLLFLWFFSASSQESMI
jgi:hypothetical protein